MHTPTPMSPSTFLPSSLLLRWETEAQRDEVPCLGIQNWESVEAGLDRAILFQSTLSYSLGTPVPPKLHSFLL